MILIVSSEKSFAVVLLFLKSGGDVGHHILIIGDAVYIYCSGFVFPLLWGALGTRWSSVIFRHRRVATRKLGELVKPVPGGKGGGAPGCDGAGVRWVHFRFLTVCHVWWGGHRPRSAGPI